MSTSVGTLTIEMAANIVRLQQDMDKARSTVENTMGKISKAAGAAGVALGALGVTVGIGAFAGWIKGAIDAADETNKLAQKIGLAVPQVAGLQLAFRQSGLDAGALQTSMSKLSVAIADGNDAFKAMNISTKNSDGSLKTTRQMLGEVADKFKDYEDGAAKTALAIQIFGRSGAELIPVLNGGSAALDEFDAMAKKLGLTLDEDTAKRAEKFNDTLDLMGQGFKGIGAQVAAQLLPTLEGLADQFFSAMTEGDRLKTIGDALATGLKGLYIVGVALVGAFRAVGDTLYAMGAQAVAVMKGDFSGAVRIGDQYAAEMKANWTNSLAEIDKAWNANGSTAVSTMAATSKAFKTQAPIVSDETKKMAAEAAKLEAEYKKLIDSIENKTGAMIADAAGTEKLSEGQKMALKIMQDLQNGTIKLTEAQKENLTATLELMLKTEEKIRTDKDLAETQIKIIKLSDQLVSAQKKETASLLEGNQKLREQNEVLRIGEAAVRAREAAVLRSTATDLEFAAATFEGNEELGTQARLLRERANLLEDGTILKEAKAAADEWKKTTDTIENGLTDALMRGFESGKGFGENLKDTLSNMFKTLILRPILQPIAQGAANSVLGSMGMSSAGSAATSAGSSIFGNLMVGGASLSAQGAAFGQGFSTAVSGMFTGGAPVSSLGSATSTAFNAGSTAAAAMPYVAAALAVMNMMGVFKSDRQVGGGLTGTLGAGNIMGYDLRREGGSLINGPSYYMANKQISELSAYLQGSFFTMRESAAVLAHVIGKSTEEVSAFTMALGDVQVHPDIAEMGVAFSSLTEEGKAAKIKEVFDKANEAMAKLVLGTTDLQHAGETAYQALQRLAGIQLTSNALNEFGGAFSNFATASITARESVINLTGGIEQLMNKAQGFVSNFYTAEEQAAITARGVVNALGQAGFSAAQIAALETRADFRALLESIDVNAENGASQFAALLDLQDEFAGLSGTMEDQQQSLIELIAAAPQVEMLQKIFESDSTYQARVQTAEEKAQVTFDLMAASLGSLNVSVDNLATVIFEAMDSMATRTAGALSAANAAIATAQASVDAEEFGKEMSILKAYLASLTTRGSDETTFASGGFYDGGMAMVGEHGPELINFGAPGQVYTAPATASIMGNGDVAAEIRALRDEVSMMRYETRATAVNTSKIAKLQDNWDVRGLTVRTDVDQPLDTVTV
jgi:hypothetical protein